jgi:hypothetical protein
MSTRIPTLLPKISDPQNEWMPKRKNYPTFETYAKRFDPDRTYPPVCYRRNGTPRTPNSTCHRPCRPAHFTREASKYSPWMLALKKFNRSKTVWCVPKDGSPGYTECMKYKREFQREARKKRAAFDAEMDLNNLPAKEYLALMEARNAPARNQSSVAESSAMGARGPLGLTEGQERQLRSTRLTNQRNAEREAQAREAKRLAEQEAYYAKYPNQRPKPRTKGGALYDKRGNPY